MWQQNITSKCDKTKFEKKKLFYQYSAPSNFPVAYEGLSPNPSHREAVVNAFVYVHQSLHQANSRISRRGGRTTAVTPRHYLDFINHYVSAVLRR